MISNIEQPITFSEAGELFQMPPESPSGKRSITVWTWEGNTLGWIDINDIVVSLNQRTSIYFLALTRYGAGWVRMDRFERVIERENSYVVY